MDKVGLIGLKEQQESLLTVLHDLGVVQIEPVGAEALASTEPERASDAQRAVGEELVRFRGLKSALPERPIGSPRRFANRQEIFDAAKTVIIDGDVGRLKRIEDAALTRRKSIEDTRRLLERFTFFHDRLDYLTAANVLSFFGEAKPAVYGRLRTEIPSLSDAQFFEEAGPDLVRFIAVVRKDQGEAVGRLAQQNGVALVAAPNVSGTIE